MSKGKRSGSLIYEILIGILIIGVIISLFIPKKVWESEKEIGDKCHSNLLNIWTLETYYKQKTKSYTNSLELLISTIKNDPSIVATLDTIHSQTFYKKDEPLSVIYHMPLDSILTCPQTGLPYVIALSDSTPVVTIKCPNEEGVEKIFGVYKKKIISHGTIKDGEVSWD